MKKGIVLVALMILLGIFSSGCVSNSTNNTNKLESNITSSAQTQNSQSPDQNKIKELENKLSSMQQQIDDLQTRVNNAGMPKPSQKNLIPRVPFRLEVKEAEMQPPTVWTFKENNELEIRYTDWTDIASYKLDPNNNTIRINSKKYEYFGLVLYDDYATAIYENGWIAWAKKYQVYPPKYNSITQKYELD